MANLVLSPVDWDEDDSGLVLTQIVPASRGCNLKCPFCLIGQRREATSPHLLQPHHYSQFINEIARDRKVVGIAIQGYEPLLLEAMPYTRAILSEARSLRIPSSLVTNGVFLRNAVSELSELTPRRVGVSIDSALPERHDRIRGSVGAWTTTVKGVEHALKAFTAHRVELQVISVMLPRKTSYLSGMPGLLKQLGVKDWIINPVMRIGTNRSGGLFGATNEIVTGLIELNALAVQSGVNMIVDDELGFLARAIDARTTMLNIRVLPKRVKLSRLTPGGHCSLGSDIAQAQQPSAPRWAPGVIHAAKFLRSVESHQNRSIRRQAA